MLVSIAVFSVAVWLLYQLAVRIRTAYFKPILSSLPGPFLARFTTLPWSISAYYHRIGDKQRAQHIKYGPYVRSGPNLVSISDARVVPSVFGARNDFPKWKDMKVWNMVKDGKEVPTLAATIDKKIHGQIRKPIASAYSMTSLSGLEPYVSQTIEYFVRRLEEEFISGPNEFKPCDIDNWLQYFAYDTIGEVTFGRRLGFLEAGGDVDGSIQDLNFEFAYRGIVQTTPEIDYIYRKNPLALLFKKTSVFANRARGRLLERLKEGAPDPSRRDLLSHFLEAQKAHPDVVTGDVLNGYITTPLAAGSDTTAVVLRSAIYFLLKHPACLTKFLEESKEVGLRHPVTFAQASQMPYLDAVLRESLRFHPVGPGDMKRVVPEGGLQLPDGGPLLPPGTVVGMGPWVVSRDKTVFGADADEFNPDRFLQGEGEDKEVFAARLAAMNKADIGWGGGTRSCIGKNIARMEMLKVLPTLFDLFEIRLVHPEKEWSFEQRFFARQHDMDITLRWKEGKSLASLTS